MRRRWGRSWRGRTLALTVSFAVTAASLPCGARADEAADPGEIGAVTSIGTLLVTSLVGGLMMGRGTNTFTRNAGTDIAGFGFAAAPVAGHLVNGEYVRAAAFSATPLVMAVGDVALMQHDPNVIDEEGTSATRVPFAIFFTIGLTSGVVGIVDTMFATHRRDERREHDGTPEHTVFSDLHVVPLVGRDSGSLSVGGTF
jgi:hypothetical protein